jgi:hypothetical protein
VLRSKATLLTLTERRVRSVAKRADMIWGVSIRFYTVLTGRLPCSIRRKADGSRIREKTPAQNLPDSLSRKKDMAGDGI